MVFFLGISSLMLTFWPVLASQFPKDDYYAQLPLSPDYVDPADAVAPTTPYPPLRTDLEDTAPGDWIRIPSIDVAVPLALSPTMDDNDVLDTLNLGAALYPNGIQPGRLGNTFISAHSTGEPWKGKYRFAFLRINELEPGNLIHLDYQGTRYTYKIAGKDIVTPSPDYQVISNRPIPTITFMACWPLWTTDQRLLVRGELTNITQIPT